MYLSASLVNPTWLSSIIHCRSIAIEAVILRSALSSKYRVSNLKFLSTLSSKLIQNLYLKHATLPPIGDFADCLMSCPICASIELLLCITEYTNLRLFLYNISSIDLCPLSGPTRKEYVLYGILNMRLALYAKLYNILLALLNLEPIALNRKTMYNTTETTCACCNS